MDPLIIGSIFLAVPLLILPIVYRLLHQLPFFVLGFILPVVAVLYIGFQIPAVQPPKPYLLSTPKSLQNIQIKSVSSNEILLHEDELLNSALNTLASHIINDFIKNWYQKVTKDVLFLVDIKIILSYMINKLELKLKGLKPADSLIQNIVPILENHIRLFIEHPTDYNDHLHPVLRGDPDDDEKKIRIYLSDSIEKILMSVLPENEVDCKITFFLIREILGSFLLGSICLNFSDPDFYNQIIENQVVKQIKDRNDVKKLRKFLRKSMDDSDTDRFGSFFLDVNISGKQYQDYANSFASTKNDFFLLKCLYYISWKAPKIVQSNEDPKILLKFQRRSEGLIAAILLRMEQLNSPLKPRSSINNPQKMCIPSQPKHKLQDILTHPGLIIFFQNWMKKRQDRNIMLDFWMAVDTLRNPLEFVDMEQESISQNKSNAKNASQLFGNFNGSTTSLRSVESNENTEPVVGTVFLDDLSQAQDICDLYDQYFDCSVLKISPLVNEKVSNFVNAYKSSKLGLIMLYAEARRALFSLQIETYIRMNQADYKAFKESDSWLKMCIEEVLRQSNVDLRYRRISGDPLAAYVEDNDHYIDVNTTGKVSDKVFKAVEDVLTQIMNDKTVNRVFLLGDEPENKRLVSEDVAHDLFGSERDKGLFGEDKTNGLFEEVGADESLAEIDNSQLHLQPKIEGTEIQMNQLVEEIEILIKQNEVLEALLKKAEIVNNVPEIKLLSKSKMSLERELAIKKLQQEQYLPHESDSDFFKNCKVNVESFHVEKDKVGKEYTTYIISVVNSYNEKSAKWTVNRRYSQFYELNHYLKTKYPIVSTFNFPKRKMVMKFQQEYLIEERLVAFNEYLKNLLNVKEICKDSVFKRFLTNQDLDRSKLIADARELAPPLSSPFLQPITEFVLTLFQLDSSGWIRGRTLIVMIQQIFGSTIEKLIRTSLATKLNPASFSGLIEALNNSLWPDGTFRKKVERSKDQKATSKSQAKILIVMFMVDTCTKIVGQSKAIVAAETIWGAVQEERLNRSLILSLLDEVFRILNEC
ncbi:Mdm1 protein [Martiniozyma asiatica (nom. inval.)]|nr:Mdm1 protein [Martiniozyma asiatica]